MSYLLIIMLPIFLIVTILAVVFLFTFLKILLIGDVLIRLNNELEKVV